MNWEFKSDGTHNGDWDQIDLPIEIEFTGDWWMEADVVHFAWTGTADYQGVSMTMHCIGHGTFVEGGGSGIIDSIFEGNTYTATWTVFAD